MGVRQVLQSRLSSSIRSEAAPAQPFCYLSIRLCRRSKHFALQNWCLSIHKALFFYGEFIRQGQMDTHIALPTFYVKNVYNNSCEFTVCRVKSFCQRINTISVDHFFLLEILCFRVAAFRCILTFVLSFLDQDVLDQRCVQDYKYIRLL